MDNPKSKIERVKLHGRSGMKLTWRRYSDVLFSHAFSLEGLPKGLKIMARAPLAQYRSDVAEALKAYSKAVSKARSIHGRDCNYDPTTIDLAYHQATADARLRYEMAEDDAYKWGDRPPRELVPAIVHGWSV